MTRQEIGEIAIKAIQKLNEGHCIGDFIYNVRESEARGWNGPRVTAWGDGSKLADQVLKELTTETIELRK